MTATTRTVTLSREASGVAGLAWAYLAALTRGTRGVAEATAILATFREVFNENRSAVVDATVIVGYPRAEAEADVPRLRPSGTLDATDSQALAFALWPYLAIAVGAGEGGWGTGDELYDLFEAVPIGSATRLRDWFLDRLASVWPQGTANAHGRLLWWFATNVTSSETASRFFVQYVFQGAGTTGDGPGTGVSSMQEAAAALLGGSTDAGATAAAIEVGPETRITAPRSSGRSAWFYLAWVGLFLAVGGTSVWLWSYNRRYGRMPWQGR